MSRTRDRFQPVWRKDAPLREASIALIKRVGMGVLMVFLVGMLPLIVGIIFFPDQEVLLWIGLVGSVGGFVWMFFRALPVFLKLAKDQRDTERGGETRGYDAANRVL